MSNSRNHLQTRLLMLAGNIFSAFSRLGFRKQAVKIFGMPLQSTRFKKQAFSDYRPTKHDIFVTVFSKSGTNWMLQIAYQITQLGNGDFDHIHDVVPWPDMPLALPATLDNETWRSSPIQKRVIKTHIEADYVPYSPQAHYITLIRDPKDAVVSGYYFAKNFLPARMNFSLEDWVDLFLEDHYFFGDWVEHTVSFWRWRRERNVLILNYPELKAEPVPHIQRIATFLGVELTSEQLAQVVEKSSFVYMKQHTAKFDPPKAIPLTFRGSLIRKGRVGESVEALSLEQRLAIDAFVQSKLKEMESDFPYASLYIARDQSLNDVLNLG